MFGTNCLTCNSAQVRRSRRRAIERILLPFAAACRCNECGRRFYSIARAIRTQHELSGIPLSGLENASAGSIRRRHGRLRET